MNLLLIPKVRPVLDETIISCEVVSRGSAKGITIYND